MTAAERFKKLCYSGRFCFAFSPAYRNGQCGPCTAFIKSIYPPNFIKVVR